MTKVRTYFGPKKGFEKYLHNNGVDFKNIKSFPLLINESSVQIHRVLNEGESTDLSHETINIETLVIKSEEYASVNEHVITNFMGVMSKYSFGNIYLHNPPDSMCQTMRQVHNDYKEKAYQYKSVTKVDICNLYTEFDEVIVGQEEAKKSILSSLIPLLRKGQSFPVVLLFWGPSGVGKTETAKLLAQKLHGNLFRKQLSMFQNSDFSTYLFGGKHNEISFAKNLLDRESNVILLDEFDKTPSHFHSAFYQLFDEGIYEDKNYHVNVKKSIVICTSNYNSLEEIREHVGEPIFTRFNGCIEFVPLDNESKAKIIHMRLDEEYNLLSDEEKEIISKEDVLDKFLKVVDKRMNARQINTLIRTYIARRILEQYVADNSKVK